MKHLHSHFPCGGLPPFHLSCGSRLEQPVKVFETVDEAVYIHTVYGVVAFHHLPHLSGCPQSDLVATRTHREHGHRFFVPKVIRLIA